MTKAKRASARRSRATKISRRTGASAPKIAHRKSKPKHKGGPIPGTPSPMRTRLSPELQAHARRAFETTDQPGTEIALDCGVDESVLRRMAIREGWVRFVAPPRDLPPVAKLLAEVEALGDGAGAAQDSTQDTTQENLERLTQIVMAHADEFERLRQNGKLIAAHHLATARAINILSEAFNRLQRLRAATSGSIHDDVTDMPADLDAFRDALARRIDAFIASRTNKGDGGGDSAAVPAVAP